MTTQRTPITEESWMLADRLPHLDLDGGAEVYEAVMTGSTHLVARVYGDGRTPQQQRASAGRRAKIIVESHEMARLLLVLASPGGGHEHARAARDARALLARIDDQAR